MMNQNNISLERVIKGLECHFLVEMNVCEKCPYYPMRNCSDDMAKDALALLKAQEHEALDMPKPDSDIGCWYDITHNYTLEQVVSALKSWELCEDAVSRKYLLLKPQPARLVTEADFENADEYGFIPTWYEGLVSKEGWWNCIPKEALETAKEDGCRYWTAKPSLKQMEETPWE